MEWKKLGIDKLYDNTGKFCGYRDTDGNIYDKYELKYVKHKEE